MRDVGRNRVRKEVESEEEIASKKKGLHYTTKAKRIEAQSKAASLFELAGEGFRYRKKRRRRTMQLTEEGTRRKHLKLRKLHSSFPRRCVQRPE